MTREEAIEVINKSRMPQDAKDALLKQFDARSQGIGLTLAAMKARQSGFDYKKTEWYRKATA